MKLPEWVKLGMNVTIDDNVMLGIGKEEHGDLIVGDNCRIRSGSVIYRGARLGDYCQTGHSTLIREKNILEDYVVIGSFTELAPGNEIKHHTTIHSQCFLEKCKIGECVFIGPGVKFLDDMLPIDPNAENYQGAIVGNDVTIGGGSVILPHIKICSRALIGAGSVVTKDVPMGEIWAGNPARLLRKIDGMKFPKSDVPYLPGTRTRYKGVRK
jgi:acetyltransferase-like isoleucine patch superfamily enzyme